MIKYEHSGDENIHEIHFTTDDYDKFHILMDVIMDMMEDEKGDTVHCEAVETTPGEYEYKLPDGLKPKFHFDDYPKIKGCFCMCCKSNEDYENFNRLVMKNGKTDCGECLNVSEYNPVCLYFNEGCHGTLGYAKEEDEGNPTVLYFDDFDWSDYGF